MEIDSFGAIFDRLPDGRLAQRPFGGSSFPRTTHKFSQIALEKIRYRPMGFFIGGEFMGGNDGYYYRQNVIYYGKHFGEGKKHIQKFDTMELTEKAEKLVNTVKELWEYDEIM
jgi:hypothetical protein